MISATREALSVPLAPAIHVPPHYQATGKHYYACIIMDATACCAKGIEFILTDDYKYPEDYPSEGDDITVEGIFDTYEELDGMYCTLKDAALLSRFPMSQ